MKPTCFRYCSIILLSAMSACTGGDDPAVATPTAASRVPPPPPPAESPWTYRPCSSLAVPSSSAAQDVLPGGIWQGWLTNESRRQTARYIAVISDDGDFRFFESYDRMFGRVSTEGGRLEGEGYALPANGTWLNGGTEIGRLSLLANMVEKSSLAGEWSVHSGEAGCFSFDYDVDLYEVPSSLAALEGEWSAPDGWGFLSVVARIDDQGNFRATDTYFCDHAGRLTLIDDRYNLFKVTSETTNDDPDSCIDEDKGAYEGLAYIYYFGDGSGRGELRISLARDQSNVAFRIQKRTSP